jgi:hypothetical protein
MSMLFCTDAWVAIIPTLIIFDPDITPVQKRLFPQTVDNGVGGKRPRFSYVSKRQRTSYERTVSHAIQYQLI